MVSAPLPWNRRDCLTKGMMGLNRKVQSIRGTTNRLNLAVMNLDAPLRSYDGQARSPEMKNRMGIRMGSNNKMKKRAGPMTIGSITYHHGHA